MNPGRIESGRRKEVDRSDRNIVIRSTDPFLIFSTCNCLKIFGNIFLALLSTYLCTSETLSFFLHQRLQIFHQRLQIFHQRLQIFYRRLQIFNQRLQIFYRRLQIFHQILQTFHQRLHIFHQRLQKFHQRPLIIGVSNKTLVGFIILNRTLVGKEIPENP